MHQNEQAHYLDMHHIQLLLMTSTFAIPAGMEHLEVITQIIVVLMLNHMNS